MQSIRLALWMAVWCFATGIGVNAEEPRWIFNHGDAADAVAVGQGTVHSALALARIVPTGTDLSVYLPFKEPFAAKDHSFFALRYRYKTTIPQAGLFFTTNTLTVLSDKSYSMFPVKGDGQWHNTTVDMTSFRHGQWKGTITSVRFDPTNPSDLTSTIEISRAGFFSTRKEADSFLAEANDKPDYTRESVFYGPRQKCIVPGRCMTEADTERDFLLDKVVSPEELRKLCGAKKISTSQLVVTREENGHAQILPLSHVNSLGFATWVAGQKGKYALAPGNPVPATDEPVGGDGEAIRYVVTRGLMQFEGNRFYPDRVIDAAERTKLVAAAKRAGMATDEFESFLSAKRTRREAAVYLRAALLERLGLARPSSFDFDSLRRPRLRIGASIHLDSAALNEERIHDFADCGFDWMLVGMRLSSATRRDVLFSAANRLGLELFLADGAHLNIDASAQYADEPCYGGHVVVDEPGSDNFAKYAKICQDYIKASNGKIPFVNLLPMYANAAQLKYGAQAAAIEYYDSDPALFKKYCDAYCDAFPMQYICTDIYPLNWDKSGKKTTYKDYVESINIIANSAREHNREFWCYIQTFGWVPSKRTPTEEEFRWQCYSMLSFGARALICWTYAGIRDFPSLIDKTGTKMPVWYAARPVLWEMRRLSDVYVQYRNLGAFAHGYSEKVPYLRISTPYAGFATIRRIECEQPLLVGCFEKTDDKSRTAFTLVNMAEFEGGLCATAKVQLNAKTVKAFYRGVPETVVPDDKGFYHFHLGNGEGVFVTVEP